MNLDPERWYESEEFRKAWWRTENIPGSFTRLNAATYFDLANKLPRHGTVIEVGVDQGRSASMLLAALYKTIPARVILVDSWESILIDNKVKTEAHLSELLDDPDLSVQIMHMKSAAAALLVMGEVDLLHIDAHHHDNIPGSGPDVDCQVWLPKVKSGGIACLHDVAATFPDVDKAVAKHLSGWEPLGVFDCLGVWRKP